MTGTPMHCLSHAPAGVYSAPAATKHKSWKWTWWEGSVGLMIHWIVHLGFDTISFVVKRAGWDSDQVPKCSHLAKCTPEQSPGVVTTTWVLRYGLKMGFDTWRLALACTGYQPLGVVRHCAYWCHRLRCVTLYPESIATVCLYLHKTMRNNVVADVAYCSCLMKKKKNGFVFWKKSNQLSLKVSWIAIITE